jgi:6-phosphogluconolactonase
MPNDRLYIGGYTIEAGREPRREGVFLCHLDANSGRLEQVAGFDVGPNPSFLAFSPDHRCLYVVNELAQGEVSAFTLDAEDGSLARINSQAVEGADPCYLTVDPTGRWLLVACYTSGNLATLPIQPGGGLGPLAEHIQHHGHGPNPDRQEQAHTHSVRFDPEGRFALVADLGMDRVWVYRLDGQTGKLTPNTPPGLDGKPGAGPRHLEFHPNGRVLYISNELDGTVTACTWDGQTGQISAFQTLSTLPIGFKEENTVADIHITPSGDYLYVSNRGHNSLAGYRVDAQSGALTPLGITGCGGDWPRTFAIPPEGRLMIVANQYSNDLVTFWIETDGSLTPTGEKLALPVPVCVLFG